MASVSSSLPDLLGNSTSSLSAVDTPFQPSEPLEGERDNKTPTNRSEQYVSMLLWEKKFVYLVYHYNILKMSIESL